MNHSGIQMTERGAWLTTQSRGRFYPLDPKEEEVNLYDIAWALSHLTRYNGHMDRFYSVAEHSVHVANQIPDVETAKWGLLHDAPEAYIGDLVRPVKVNFPLFCELEDNIMFVIAKKFKLKGDKIPKEVHKWDNILCATEKEYLLHGSEHWENMPDPINMKYPLGVSAKIAYQKFMNKYYELWGRPE